MTAPEVPEAMISTRLLTRIIIGLIAVWSLLVGIVLVGFQGAASGALGAGVVDPAGQRVIGAHLLVLAPAYVLMALQPQRYEAIFWLPFAAQLAVVLAVGYSILAGDTDFGDGILAVAIGGIFIVLLGFFWITEQRTAARLKMEEEERDDSEPSLEPGASLEPPEA